MIICVQTPTKNLKKRNIHASRCPIPRLNINQSSFSFPISLYPPIFLPFLLLLFSLAGAINSYHKIQMWNILRRVSLTKTFNEGAAIRPEHFQLPHKQNMNLLAAMFELRKWFIFNSPHKYYSQKYTNEMAHLHNELNYLHSRLLIQRGVLVFGIIYSIFWFVSEPDAIDWKDNFDLKHNERTYGTMTTSAGEGGISIDQ